MKRKIITVLSLILIAALFLTACNTLSDAAKLTEYDFGTDKVPTINSVIGTERKVTGVSSGTSNGIKYKEYTYQTDSTFDDLLAYVTALMNDYDWMAIEDYNLNDPTGTVKLAIESADSGKILIMTITYKANEYTIRIEKGDGTLTRY